MKNLRPIFLAVVLLICALASTTWANDNAYRYRLGEMNPMTFPVASATVIKIGDLVYIASGNILPADSQADLGTEDQNKDGIADAFAGVAMTSSAAGDTTWVTVATSGVFEFPLDAAGGAIAVGTPLSVAADASVADGDAVERAAALTDDIGFCWREAAPAATTVYIAIRTLYNNGLAAD